MDVFLMYLGGLGLAGLAVGDNSLSSTLCFTPSTLTLSSSFLLSSSDTTFCRSDIASFLEKKKKKKKITTH